MEDGPARYVLNEETRVVPVDSQSDRSPRMPVSLLSKQKFLRFDVKVFYYFGDEFSEQKISADYEHFKREKPVVHQPLANKFKRKLVVNVPPKIMVSDLRSAPWLRYLRILFFLLGLEFFFLLVVECWT